MADPTPTEIITTPGNGMEDSTINLNVTLIDDNETPLSNKTITYMLEEDIIGSVVTDSQGVATLPYNLALDVGIYTIDTNFIGNTVYASSSNTITLTLYPLTDYYADIIKVTKLTSNIKSGLRDDNLFNDWLEIALSDSNSEINSSLNNAMIPLDPTNNPLLATDVNIENAGTLFATGFLFDTYYSNSKNLSQTSKKYTDKAERYIKDYIDNYYRKGDNSGYSRSQSPKHAFHQHRHSGYREW